MLDSNFSKSDKAFKIIALLAGIVIGSFYASFGHTLAKQWMFPKKLEEASTAASFEINEVFNETAAFLVPDDTTVADKLARDISVLCWIYRNDISEERVSAIKATWGLRCTKLLFLIKNNEKNISDVISLKSANNTKPTIEDAYKYLYTNHLNDFGWFLKTTGNNYVVMENLRYMLYNHDPKDSIGFGHVKTDKWKEKNTTNDKTYAYYADEAGYVISKEALNKLNLAFQIGPKCALFKKMNKRDDERIGMCLEEMNVVVGESKDQYGKKRFYEMYFEDFLLPKIEVDFPYPWYSDYKVDHHLNDASNYSIAFNGISEKNMHVMEYLIYQLRAFGVENEMPPLPEK